MVFSSFNISMLIGLSNPPVITLSSFGKGDCNDLVCLTEYTSFSDTANLF